jgi:hypothetical protein
MDVEGFELHVLRGAGGLLQQHNVWYIMLECNPDLVGGRKGQLEYLRCVGVDCFVCLSEVEGNSVSRCLCLCVVWAWRVEWPNMYCSGLG